MNQELTQSLSQLKEKVKNLVHTNEQLAKSNGKLENNLAELKKEVEKQQASVERLKTELRAKEASNAMHADNQKIEKEIDKYIKLIDNSIASIQKDL